MQNRQKHEIYRDILTVCNGGAIISRVMFHTYISHVQAKAYLSEMIEMGLIETDIYNSKKYLTTAKGLSYMSALENMIDMLAIETRRARLIA
jgi:predicted transcriptional regulator